MNDFLRTQPGSWAEALFDTGGDVDPYYKRNIGHGLLRRAGSMFVDPGVNMVKSGGEVMSGKPLTMQRHLNILEGMQDWGVGSAIGAGLFKGANPNVLASVPASYKPKPIKQKGMLPYSNEQPAFNLPKVSKRYQGLMETPRVIREDWLKDLTPNASKTVKWYKNHPGETAIHANQKTGLSVDFSTTCPKRGCKDGACPYCYVEIGRGQKKVLNMHGANKGFYEQDYNGEVATWSPDLVRSLNKDGGLRMFSFGDYRPDVDHKNVSNLLNDAHKQGLYVKAITKQPEFIKEFGDHPNLRVNISVDNVPREISQNAPTIDEAMALKGGRDNIKIRAVALNKQEAEMYGKDPRIDVITLYHGLTNFNSKGKRTDNLLRIIKEQNPELYHKVGEEKLRAYTDTWESFKPKSKKHTEVMERYKGRVCCEGGKCSKDKTKCGFGVGALLLMGVRLSDNIGEENEKTIEIN